MRRRRSKPTPDEAPSEEALLPSAPVEPPVRPTTRRWRFPFSLEFLIRLIGAGFAAYGGYLLAGYLSSLANVTAPEQQFLIALPAVCLTAALGLIVTPFVTTRPLRWLRHRMIQAPAHELLAGLIGLLIGLILSALLAIPLQFLPSPLGQVTPFLAMLGLVYLGVTTMVMRKRDLANLLGGLRNPIERGDGRDRSANARATGSRIILDTSAIIDGRIADVTQTGFIGGPLVVSRFVLNELQHIADSSDALRRNRGRRGLELLGKLQKDAPVPVEVVEIEPAGADVDAKLVKMAKQMGCAILTNDYNLNRVAALQGVRVLNINELANALKAIVLPGEEMPVRVIQEGKEFGQGVGYLDDGTMVVVENGRRYLGSQITVVVTRVLQTVAGRMIFGHPKE
ncbi:MAG: PIN domain-containing protein [Chloroflexi bacterium]|nr:PIN domain-containing protein [Chloroflexota bacterium]MCL5110991.1 PIN domain-containing protein [Chloroflexota bacterium]